MLKALRLWWHGRSTRRKMDRVFSRGADPYRYAESPYERGRLDAMERALPERCGRALEVGCAEGAFTSRLAARSRSLAAVDISEVALERARKRLAAASNTDFFAGDVRLWSPPAGALFDVVVLGDVLYYLDKPLVQDEFLRTFDRIAGWLAPGATLLLAHGFAGAAERPGREGYRKRFEERGLSLVSESVVGEGEAEGKVCCLLSVLRKPGEAR